MYLLISIWNKIIVDNYQEKLNIDLFKVLDPLSIKSGWIGEKQGMITLPAIFFHNIAKYFEAKSPADFIIRLYSEYGQGKAFLYFACELFKIFLKESLRILSVLYNENQNDIFLENLPERLDYCY